MGTGIGGGGHVMLPEHLIASAGITIIGGTKVAPKKTVVINKNIGAFIVMRESGNALFKVVQLWFMITMHLLVLTIGMSAIPFFLIHPCLDNQSREMK